MARNKKAWREAKRMVDRVVSLIRSMDNSVCERKLHKNEYAMLMGVLISAGPIAEAAYGEMKQPK